MNEAFCQNCWVPESPCLPLVDMRQQIYKLKNIEVNALTFFEHLRQVKIENAVKICHSCIHVLGRVVYQQLTNTTVVPNIVARARDSHSSNNVQYFDLVDTNAAPGTKMDYKTIADPSPVQQAANQMVTPEPSSSQRSKPARSRYSSVKKETPEQRERRLEYGRQRMRMKRLNETPEERARRLEYGKNRMKMRRAAKQLNNGYDA